jgi:quercetin dioxygenase-like cupin family protein
MAGTSQTPQITVLQLSRQTGREASASYRAARMVLDAQRRNPDHQHPAQHELPRLRSEHDEWSLRLNGWASTP